MQAFNVLSWKMILLTKSSGYVEIISIYPDCLKIKHALREAFASTRIPIVRLIRRTVTIELSPSWSSVERFPNESKHITDIVSRHLRSCPDHFQREGRSRDNHIVYDETLDACLPPLLPRVHRGQWPDEKVWYFGRARRDKYISARSRDEPLSKSSNMKRCILETASKEGIKRTWENFDYFSCTKLFVNEQGARINWMHHDVNVIKIWFTPRLLALLFV